MLALVFALVFTRLTPVDLAHRESDFRAANPQHWTALTLDAYGYVQHAVSDDPALVAADPAALRDFARRNAARFHLDPRDVDRLAPVDNRVELVVQSEGVLLGMLRFTRGPHELAIDAIAFANVTPKITRDAIVRRATSRTYTAAIELVSGPPPDCGRRGHTCPPPVRATIHHDVRPTAADLVTTLALHRDGDEVRLVRCAELSLDIAPAVTGPASAPHRSEVTAPGLPLVLDAVTGETLRTGVAHCAQLDNARP